MDLGSSFFFFLVWIGLVHDWPLNGGFSARRQPNLLSNPAVTGPFFVLQNTHKGHLLGCPRIILKCKYFLSNAFFVCIYIYVYTVWCRYNVVNFLQIPLNRHSIARPHGPAIECLFWVYTLIYILHQSMQWRVKYHVILDHVIMALKCKYIYILSAISNHICSTLNVLNHHGLVTPYAINDLSTFIEVMAWRQAITETNADLLWTYLYEISFQENVIENVGGTWGSYLFEPLCINSGSSLLTRMPSSYKSGQNGGKLFWWDVGYSEWESRT